MRHDPIEKIEILSLDLFDTHREEMRVVERMQRHFGCDIGWHYYLDLAWIIRELKTLSKGALVLDAGAGMGLSQFILSELGYNVISCDFADRNVSDQYIERYGGVIHFLNAQGKTFDNRYTRHLKAVYSGGETLGIGRILGLLKKRKIVHETVSVSEIEKLKFKGGDGPRTALEGKAIERCGRIFLYKCDLKDMPLLPDGFVDAVVSVSSLEHNDHDDFKKCIGEMLRVTKSMGKIIVTVSASQAGDWFHEPSKGWCYGEDSLKRLFKLSDRTKSNFQCKDDLFRELRKEGNELHKRLSPFYFKSGDNGMPWGRWDPKYQPVGVVKVKD